MKSLIFFALIIGIDIFLKSLKDKKNIEELRRKKMKALRTKKNIKTSKTYGDMEIERRKDVNIVEEIKTDEFFGEGKSYLEEHEGYRERYQKRYNDIESSYGDKSLVDKEHHYYDKKTKETTEIREHEKMDNLAPRKLDLRENIINGIVFSEILGKPKSLQKNKYN